MELRSNDSKRRIVVTGMGVITGSGTDLASFWSNVSNGKSAASEIHSFNIEKLPTKIGVEVNQFAVSKYTKFPRAGRYDRSVQFSLAAASRAHADAGLIELSVDPTRIGVIEGTTISGMESILKANASLAKSYDRIHPYNVVGGYFGEGSSAISIALQLRGHAMTYCSGCSSGADAIGYARQIIEDDEADVMLAGGSEALTELLHSGFCKLKAMTERNDDPTGAMRPFDQDRDGFVIGEGAGYLVLEELGHALSRGAKIYAELASHARVSEAYHSTDPHPDGLGYQRSISRALKKANTQADAIDYINAHASATPLNDPVESFAITTAFQGHAKNLQVSGSKPIFGHLMGAAGAVESIVTILSIHHAEIPPSINISRRDGRCRLDYAETKRPYPVEHALCLNAGFGGRYSCLYYRKW